MGVTKTSLRQSVHRNKLDQLTTDALYQASPAGGKPAGSTEADNLLTSLNSEVTPPLRMRPTDPTADRIVHIDAITIVNPETGKNRIAPPINKLFPTFTGATVTLPAIANGASDIVVSVGNDVSSYSQTASTFVKCAAWLDDGGNVILSFGTEGASLALAGDPDFEKKTQFIGYFVIETDSSQNIQNVEFGNIYQAGGGGAGGGGIDKWEASAKYGVDDVIWYENNRNIFVCTSAHTSTSSFDETKFELLSSDGYTVTLGETVAVGEAIYISVGTASGDTGRTQGSAYLLDVTNAFRSNYAGICVLGGNVGDPSIVSSGGNVKGFTGLATGTFIYASDSAPGDWQANSPSTSGYKIVILGVAIDTTHLLVAGTIGNNAVSVDFSGSGSLDIFYQQNFEGIITAASATTGLNATYRTAGTFGGALTNETSNPIAGTTSIRYTAGASSTNDWYDFGSITLDEKQQDEWVGITLWCDMSNFSVDAKFVVWDETNSAELTVAVSDLIVGGEGKTRYSFAVKTLSNTASISYGFHMTTAPVNAEYFIVDDFEFTVNPFVYKNLLDEQFILHASASSTLVNRGATNNLVAFTLSNISEKGSALLTYANNSNRTEFLATRKCKVDVSFSAPAAGTNMQLNIARSREGFNIISGSSAYASGSGGAVSGEIELEAGEYFYITLGSVDIGNVSDPARLVISASAETEHIVTPAKAGSETVTYTGYTSGTSAGVKYKTAETDASDKLIEVDNTGSYTLYTFLEECDVRVSSSQVGGSTLNLEILVKNSLGTTRFSFLGEGGGSSYGGASGVFRAAKGDYLVSTLSAAPTDNTRTNYSVTATPVEATFLAAIPVQKTVYLKDVKTSGTSGGASSVNTVHTRDLNISEGDTEIAPLSANQFTLGRGKYEINAAAPGYQTGKQQIFLYNVTDATYDIDGESGGDAVGTSDTTIGHTKLEGQISISSTKVYELRHWTALAKATNGLGYPSNGTNNPQSGEVYTQVKITKIS